MSIKFMATNPENGRVIFGIVIEEGNIQHLKKMRPIHINAEDMFLSEIKCQEIIITYFPTFEDAVKELKEKGYIDKDTVINYPVKKKGH